MIKEFLRRAALIAILICIPGYYVYGIQTLARTGQHGVRVKINALELAAAADSAATTITLNRDMTVAGWAANDTITCEAEELILTSGTGTLVSLTDTVYQAHGNGSNVLSRDGTTLLTYTFTGSDVLSSLRMGGDVEAHYRISVDDGTNVRYYHVTSNPYQLEVIMPMIRYTPANGVIITISVWTWVQGTFYAEMQS